MTSVKLENISKQFGDTQVISELDLSVVEGEFLTLVGPSGCGKSTLLRIIAGLEQQTRGHISIAGAQVENRRPSERDLAMVFQSYALYPHLTVFDNIAVPLRMRLLNTWQRLPVVRKFIRGTRQLDETIHLQVMEVAKNLEITELLKRKPGQLSGGQRQRVAVGRAIVRDPKAFLFDEPLSNLDAKLRVHMRAEITKLHSQLKTTFIYVTHDQVEAMTMSDRIAVMMKGEIVQIGTPSEVYHNPRDIRVAQFIGSPEINLLAGIIIGSDTVRLAGLQIDIPFVFSGHCGVEHSREVAIGIRPENLFINNKFENCSNTYRLFRGRVTFIENLGAEVFVHIAIEPVDSDLDSGVHHKHVNNTMIIRLTYEAAIGVRLNQIIDVGFSLESLLVFDADGKRIDSISRIDTPRLDDSSRYGVSYVQ